MKETKHDLWPLDANTTIALGILVSFWLGVGAGAAWVLWSGAGQ